MALRRWGASLWSRAAATRQRCASMAHNDMSRSRRSAKPFSSLRDLIQIDESVQDALQHNRPVVALESTIVAHGMPYPHNLELSKAVATILRNKGVEPATIAICNGTCRVGLNADELEDLARAGQEGRAQKCSTRELSLFLAQQRQRQPATNDDTTTVPQVEWGATTVASTMVLAHAAGIRTFVTGGIGGVHRDGQETLDISADLTELARTPVIVVSAGIKSILDIPRTLEVLETNAVPTVAFATDEFPAFFSPHSGVEAPARMDTPKQIADAFQIARALQLPHGMLVAVPNEHPAGTNIENAIQLALAQARQDGIHGQAVTPYVLQRVADETGGDSLKSNMQLVQRNAEVGADIAIAIAKRQQEQTASITRQVPAGWQQPNSPRSRVVVVGGMVLDIVAKPTHKLILGTSNPASCTESDGGVGRNVAEALGRLGSQPVLYSAVGDDARGIAMLHRLETECGVQVSSLTVPMVPTDNTATYLAVLNGDGDLHTACADMTVFDSIQVPASDVLEDAEILVLDANPPTEVLSETALRASRAGVEVFFEPTSVPKALEAAKDAAFLSCLTYASPSLDELWAMGGSERRETADDNAIRSHATELLNRMHRTCAHLIITMGEKGVLLASRDANDEPSFRLFSAEECVDVENATGAGDSLTGAFVHALLNGSSVEKAVLLGMEAAKLSIQCPDRAISPLLSDYQY